MKKNVFLFLILLAMSNIICKNVSISLLGSKKGVWQGNISKYLLVCMLFRSGPGNVSVNVYKIGETVIMYWLEFMSIFLGNF